MEPSRYVVGIDLGTTNSALAYLDADEGDKAKAKRLPVPQVVKAGVVEDRMLLPSFLYLPGPKEQPAGALKLPWTKGDPDEAVGEFARDFGGNAASRLVSSAKSWLCHPGVDRKADILPWKAPDDARKVSPLEASAKYLRHLAAAWDRANAKFPLAEQDVILTVPASFDAAARDLTVEAARLAGLTRLTLLEEPQAAFYAWLDAVGDGWRKGVKAGERVLVADVGGGTSDFTLIEVGDEAGRLELRRVAVGDHLLLGGDNMDLALAYAAAAKLQAGGTRLDTVQMQQLTFAARKAKETILADATVKSAPLTVLGRGSKLIGNTLKTDLTRDDVEKVLLDGFFPLCGRDDRPKKQRGAGLQEIGLPYAADAAITRHVAAFLGVHAPDKVPGAVLFNGGVFKPDALRNRILDVLGQWGGAQVRELEGADPDTAVARGAAYYGLVRRGQGVRIRGGTARTYYVGVESSLPAVPGFPAPIKALCVAPFGMEEGTALDLPQREFGLVVGEEAEFRFLGSSTRKADAAGTLLDDWQDDAEELAPLAATLEVQKGQHAGQVVPVHLRAEVTEVGQLEISCLSRDGGHKWKLAFDVRERD